jgi:hypothetical protein
MGYLFDRIIRKSLMVNYIYEEDRLQLPSLNSIAVYKEMLYYGLHDVKEHKLIIEPLKLLQKVSR